MVEQHEEQSVEAAVPGAQPVDGTPPQGLPGSAGKHLLDAPLPAFARTGDAAPHARILSNGRYGTLVTGAGTGHSWCTWWSVTRWAGDRVADADGVRVFLRDADRGEHWSLGSSPALAEGGTFFARAAVGSVLLGRRHRGIEATCEIVVPEGEDAEARRLRIRNRSAEPRRIEVTVVAELVVGHRGGDQGHPAFSKLFVETAAQASGVLTARRRPRSRNESPLWAAAALHGAGELQFETDRNRFVGRGRSLHDPAAMLAEGALSGTVGSVLDPVFALRRVVEIPAGGEASLAFALAAGTAAETVVAAAASAAAKASDEASWRDVLKSAASVERMRRKRFGLAADHAELAQELAGALAYAHPAMAAPAERRASARGDAGLLGRLGLAADALLVALPLGHADSARRDQLASLVGYWRDLGLHVAQAWTCREDACTPATCPHRQAAAAAGAVLACEGELGREACDALEAEARWLVGETAPSLGGTEPEAARPRRAAGRSGRVDEAPAWREALQYDNGYGGFSADGREYVVRVGPEGSGALPPSPWSNVVANPGFGFLVTERGAGFTWAGNSRQNKLTPWSNDPVSDPHGEALYLRDAATGRLWSPQPGPVPAQAWCEVRHGMGWSRWKQRSEALEQEVTVFVAGAKPAKLTRVRLANKGSRERRVSLTSFAQLVLGVNPAESSRFVSTWRDAATGVLLACNPMRDDDAGAVAFAAVVSASAGAGDASWTMDRQSFLGRGGTTAAPQALLGDAPLDGATAGDACFALQVPLVLAPRGEAEVVLALGQASNEAEALALVAALREPGAPSHLLEESLEGWRDLVGAVEVFTPSKPLDLMLNGWLLYQALSCRIHARSAFHQSGGAFGFRDQLQDSTALLHARPDLARAQLLLHAAHQFVEGDVLHWWHPPAARGTRTRFSDDLLWLPFVAATYLEATGDESVLDEKVPFVQARPLAGGEDEAYLAAARSGESASLYEHCRRAIDRSLVPGPHGLPLMGTGDWNDGMNRVGREGRGESVWLAFFLADILGRFADLASRRSDWESRRRWASARERIVAAVEESAWDGQWYRRAWYDDGTPLGSAASDECRIDAIAQAWSVLSGVASPERGRRALHSVEEQLVDEEAGIVRLLWPPFDRTSHDPGYIKGYVPGIRENGGQYSHAAMWVVRALAADGQRDKALRWFEMVSPVMHASDRPAADGYKVEPYVVAADVYGVDPHRGRGGWTWYTGSAAWMYRTGLESILGITIEAGRLLRVRPCVPDSWAGFRVRYRLPDRRTVYDVEVSNPTGRAASVVSASVDHLTGMVEGGSARVVLRRDGKVHKVKVVLG